MRKNDVEKISLKTCFVADVQPHGNVANVSNFMDVKTDERNLKLYLFKHTSDTYVGQTSLTSSY